MKDVTVSQIARKSGLSVSFVSRLMSGKRKPSMATLIGLAQNLDMSTDEVIRWLWRKNPNAAYGRGRNKTYKPHGRNKPHGK